MAGLTLEDFVLLREQRRNGFDTLFQQRLCGLQDMFLATYAKRDDAIITTHNFATCAFLQGDDAVEYKNLRNKAGVQLLREIVHEDLSDLIRVGYGFIRMNQQQRLLERERERLYVHFLNELGWLCGFHENIDAFLPGITELLRVQMAPVIVEQTAKLERVLVSLRKARFISSLDERSLYCLLSPPPTYKRCYVQPQSTTLQSIVDAAAITAESSTVESSCATGSGSAKENNEDAVIGLLQLFDLPVDFISHHASQLTTKQIETVYDSLAQVLGDENSKQIISTNPVVLLYQAEKKLTKYISALVKIDEALKVMPELAPQYGIRNNFTSYCSLEDVLELKRLLYSHFHITTGAEKVEENPFTIVAYKASLLAKAGFGEDAFIVSALTEGKNLQYKGRNSLPRRHFWHNVVGKVGSAVRVQFDDTFDALIRENVIVKGSGKDIYSLQHDIDRITNPFLAEYMRVVLYQEQLMARGELPRERIQ